MTEGRLAGMTEGRAWPALGSFGLLSGEWTALHRLVKPAKEALIRLRVCPVRQQRRRHGRLAWPRETRPYGEICIREWGSLTGGTIKPEPHRLR